MNRNKFLKALAFLLFAFTGFADNARFYVQILDELTAKPIKNIRVHGTFTSKYSRWNNATKYSDFSAVTDKKGLLFFSGETNCGRAGFKTDKTERYYGSPWIRVPYENKGLMPFSNWQPDNLVVTLRLDRVEKPIPLFVKRATLRNYHNGIGGFDGTNCVVRFDVLKGDWLPPYGKGETADFEFKSTLAIKDRERKFRYATRKVEDVLFYELVTKISACSANDALSRCQIKEDSGIKIRTANDEFSSRQVQQARGMRKKIRPKFPKEWNCEYYSDYDKSSCYQFRARTRYDEKGNLKEAYYGKIYGDFEIEGNDKKGLIGISFLYYLNPNSLDRNLEWDMKTNLCLSPDAINRKEP